MRFRPEQQHGQIVVNGIKHHFDSPPDDDEVPPDPAANEPDEPSEDPTHEPEPELAPELEPEPEPASDAREVNITMSIYIDGALKVYKPKRWTRLRKLLRWA